MTLAQTLTKMSTTTKLTPDEIKLRGSLLAKNKELLKLHKDLVFSNVISEEEFWEDRRGLLRAQELLMNQKKGLTSALVSDDLKPVTQNSDVKYILTPTIIQTIFDQHPILKKAFTELVGEGKVLGEREFWIEYFKSKFFSDSKATSGSKHIDPYFADNEMEAALNEEVEHKVSGQVDISRSEQDHVSDYVRYEREAAANDDGWNSLKQFNRHSMRVLQSTTTDPNAKINDSYVPKFDYIEISDLKLHDEPFMATLNVHESQLFASMSASSTSEQDSKTNETSILENMKLALADFESPDRNDPSSFAKMSYPQRQSLMNEVLKRNNFITPPSNPDASSTNFEESDETAQLISSSVEILRHFWRAATLTTKMTPERSAKLCRMISVLERMEPKIEKIEHLSNLKEVIVRAKKKCSEIV